ncbi:MAG: EAL domain-containing protein, partial [Candidatus Thiodiazotropha sp.]
VNYLPDEGFLARIGDDEFCLLLDGHDMEQGYLAAETLRVTIDEFAFEWKGRLIPSSASVGIVQPDSSEQTPGELMQAAQAACNMAKEGGGNCSRIYLASDSAYQDQQQLVQSLPTIKEALTNGRMELYVQPIVPLREGMGLLLHHEILLRIRNEAGELETPQDFVRAAEQYDLMRAVDRWVVEAFFDLVEPYADRLPPGHSFAINLSGKSVGDGEFRGFLKERIYASPLHTRRLGFEITETALVGDISDTAVFIEEIRKLGCSFSLDDFGSGYASFSYLKDFPVNFVKIDGVFVREILSKPADLAMINTITEIAHFMDKRVIAEYVSDAGIAQALTEIGVDYGQGYYFDKPRPLREVLAEIVKETAEKASATPVNGH